MSSVGNAVVVADKESCCDCVVGVREGRRLDAEKVEDWRTAAGTHKSTVLPCGTSVSRQLLSASADVNEDGGRTTGGVVVAVAVARASASASASASVVVL